MIVSTERWRALTTRLGLLGTVMGGDHGQGNPNTRSSKDDRGTKTMTMTMTMSRDAEQSSRMFPTLWQNFPTTMHLDRNYKFSFTVVDEGFPHIPVLMLCYAEAPQARGLSDSNTRSVLANISYTCPQTPGDADHKSCNLTSRATIPWDVTVGFSPTIPASDFAARGYQNNSTNSFFFCFTMDDLKAGDAKFRCSSYSPFFGLEAAIPSPVAIKVQQQEPTAVPPITSSTSATQTAAATTVLEITASLSILSIFASSPTSLPSSLSQSTYTSHATTVTTTLTSPPTSTSNSNSVSATMASTSSVAPSHSPGLPLSAKIGTIILTFLLLLLLLATILLLHRRQRQRNPPPSNPSRSPKNLLLPKNNNNNNNNNNNDSRDRFIAEKLGLALAHRTHTNTPPLTSRGAGMGMGGAAAYEHEDGGRTAGVRAHAHAPGTALTADTAVSSSQAASTLRSGGDRDGEGDEMGNRAMAIGVASGASRPVSPPVCVRVRDGATDLDLDLGREREREREQGSREQSGIGEERRIFDRDRDPYADADDDDDDDVSGTGLGAMYRGTLHAHAHAPFLSEPGMSAEEVARLEEDEEEERRIDEAIAEAEAEEGRRRAGERGK
ncbi:hypothetical protein DSL72_008250 [Monilinia vaccinii-corymbosi]|uniref:Uncharacterized protein n=1 Tax=Monilinia vaccinii-corymbosi TaxID=61207 RepID=A0A8A3PJV7_9HELO|nr:hypothetical protein DSL72_008250 [Monilinia vaccinii-corymbosi]